MKYAHNADEPVYVCVYVCTEQTAYRDPRGRTCDRKLGEFELQERATGIDVL